MTRPIIKGVKTAINPIAVMTQRAALNLNQKMAARKAKAEIAPIIQMVSPLKDGPSLEIDPNPARLSSASRAKIKSAAAIHRRIMRKHPGQVQASHIQASQTRPVQTVNSHRIAGAADRAVDKAVDRAADIQAAVGHPPNAKVQPKNPEAKNLKAETIAEANPLAPITAAPITPAPVIIGQAAAALNREAARKPLRVRSY